MITRKEYIITLPSDTPGEYNTPNKYTTQLSLPLNLSSNELWEIGLVNITYPSSWLNISKNEIIMSISKNDVLQHTFTIPPGAYTWDNLINAVKIECRPNPVFEWCTIRITDKVFYFIKQ